MKITDRHAFFYTEWPSNFANTRFTWQAFGETHEFFCTEQAFMWAKAMYFGDAKSAEEILKPQKDGNTPMWCKQCGRWVQGYDDYKWSLVRYSFMYDVNLCKYSQDEKLKKKLLDGRFDGLEFVEASPTDRIWGIGLGLNDPNIDDENAWHGTNLLGKVITAVRKTLLGDISDVYVNESQDADLKVKDRISEMNSIRDITAEMKKLGEKHIVSESITTRQLADLMYRFADRIGTLESNKEIK